MSSSLSTLAETLVALIAKKKKRERLQRGTGTPWIGDAEARRSGVDYSGLLEATVLLPTRVVPVVDVDPRDAAGVNLDSSTATSHPRRIRRANVARLSGTASSSVATLATRRGQKLVPGESAPLPAVGLREKLVDVTTRTLRRWVKTRGAELAEEMSDEGWHDVTPHDARRT